MTSTKPIRLKERDAIVQSLRAGVVPRIGHQHIQVARKREVEALQGDIDRLADGGSGVRFIIGEFGSGKTFFLFLVRAMALQKKLVTMHADLTADRRLHGSGGQARALYAELARSTSTRAKPDGGALPSVVEQFINTTLDSARLRGVPTEVVLRERLACLTELVGGYDFASVITRYWQGHDNGSELVKSDAVRWLRGEFSTKTDARAALGVRTIIDDEDLYNQLKLLARFVRLAGFAGLLVCLDEMVNVYKLANTRSRQGNYEQILRIVNDCLQGTAEALGFLFAGTPDFLSDPRKGLYSHDALRGRLAENTFAVGALVDLSGPVIRLANLTPEDMYVLLIRLRHVYARGDPSAYLLPDDALKAFMAHCARQVGDAYFRTPRNTVKEFLNLLAVIDQNPGTRWEDLLSGVRLAEEPNPDLVPLAASPDDDTLGEVAYDLDGRRP